MLEKRAHFILALLIIVMPILAGGFYTYLLLTKLDDRQRTEIIVRGPATDKTDSKEPLAFSISGLPISVSKKTIPFGETVQSLSSLAEECGHKQTESYYQKLVQQFNGAIKTEYTFSFSGESQAPRSFTLTILPNEAGYTTLADFQKDFDQCFAGGFAYPVMLDDNWLLFMSGCGSGYADESGLPNGCEEVRKLIAPSLKFEGKSVIQ